MVNASHLAARTDGGRVVQVEALVHEADNGRTVLCSLGDLGKSNLVVGNEPGLQEQVFRWVAGDYQFGEHRQVGSRLLGATERVDHPLDVAGEVADHGVHLAEGDAQPCHEHRA